MPGPAVGVRQDEGDRTRNTMSDQKFWDLAQNQNERINKAEQVLVGVIDPRLAR
jgi:hypothetical protein